jgi:outer membrane protein OmpA-like peptidoglycan-associated protein
MVMKNVTTVLGALLAVTLGASAFFYLNTFKPMAVEYEKMKAGMHELDKAKAALTRYNDKESRETAWLRPAADALGAGLSDEIKVGKAEVLTADHSVVVNIAEDALYMPGSYTFTRESEKLLLKLEALLRAGELKGREIIIGNTTEAVPARGKGRKKIPAKDARTLAAERSAALVKHLEKKGMDQNALIAAAYSSKQPELGSGLKARKIVIIIKSPPAVQAGSPIKEPAPAAKPSAPAAPQAAPKAIPIQPAKPKAN